MQAVVQKREVQCQFLADHSAQVEEIKASTFSEFIKLLGTLALASVNKVKLGEPENTKQLAKCFSYLSASGSTTIKLKDLIETMIRSTISEMAAILRTNVPDLEPLLSTV